MKESVLHKQIVKKVKSAKEAAYLLALTEAAHKNDALRKMAKALLSRKSYLIRENNKDVFNAKKANYSKALVDRLILDDKRIQAMADGLLELTRLKDSVGEIIEIKKRPNGLVIKKVRVPIGVIGIIYESRPNVTSDCIGLCLKSGNSVILKGGKEALYSNKAIFSVLRDALRSSKISMDSIQFIDSLDRQAVNILLKQDKYVDLVIPRGGESLIELVVEQSRIPVIKHYKGICHTYVSRYADLKKAQSICFNAKVQRPGVCNAMETLLVDQKIAAQFLPTMIQELQNANVEIRGCDKTRKIIKENVKKATEQDWYTEYLDLILSVKVVSNFKEAIDHINKYGSHHSDAIVTNNKKEAEQFLKSIDSATVYVNASTRFTDGYEFGLGAEIGISTDKLHARGPMALEELTTYKYEIYGSGQTRS